VIGLLEAKLHKKPLAHALSVDFLSLAPLQPRQLNPSARQNQQLHSTGSCSPRLFQQLQIGLQPHSSVPPSPLSGTETYSHPRGLGRRAAHLPQHLNNPLVFAHALCDTSSVPKAAPRIRKSLHPLHKLEAKCRREKSSQPCPSWPKPTTWTLFTYPRLSSSEFTFGWDDTSPYRVVVRGDPAAPPGALQRNQLQHTCVPLGAFQG
jgi:hypothetical protein